MFGGRRPPCGPFLRRIFADWAWRRSIKNQPLPDIGWAVYQGLLTPVLLLLEKWSKQRW
jgi:hypothetical protein